MGSLKVIQTEGCNLVKSLNAFWYSYIVVKIMWSHEVNFKPSGHVKRHNFVKILLISILLLILP
jgi:hypothetical protein